MDLPISFSSVLSVSPLPLLLSDPLYYITPHITYTILNLRSLIVLTSSTFSLFFPHSNNTPSSSSQFRRRRCNNTLFYFDHFFFFSYFVFAH